MNVKNADRQSKCTELHSGLFEGQFQCDCREGFDWSVEQRQCIG